MAAAPKLLVTGFGPFPGALGNPTERLVKSLSRERPDMFGASELQALVLPTEYQRSWTILQGACASFAPDIAIHFGLSSRHKTIRLECLGHNAVSIKRADAAGYCPASRRIADVGPAVLPVTLPVDAIGSALRAEGYRTLFSSDAGDYVCNATLYRSLVAARLVTSRWVGFIHVPPEGAGGYTRERLKVAAGVILSETTCAWSRYS